MLRLAPYTHEQLYAARRFPVNRSGGLSSALRLLRAAMETEQVALEVKERRYMVTPCETRNLGKFYKRQSVFRGKVRDHVQRIMEIEESLK